MMADVIGRHGISADAVAEMLTKCSPGAPTSEKQQALRKGVKSLEVLFLESQETVLNAILPKVGLRACHTFPDFAIVKFLVKRDLTKICVWADFLLR